VDNHSQRRTTQVIERPHLAGQMKLEPLIRQIEHGEEPRQIFQFAVEQVAKLDGIRDALILLPGEEQDKKLTIIARSGDSSIDGDKLNREQKISSPLQSLSYTANWTKDGALIFYDLVCLGAPVGSLVIKTDCGLTDETHEFVRYCSHSIASTYERQKLSATIQVFLDRLEVLNQLNQLIVGNTNLQRIVKSIARESAFRFAADLTIAWLYDDNHHNLEPRGGYGCTPDLLPKSIDASHGVIGEAIRHGGNLSFSNIKKRPEHGLSFIEELGIEAVNICCLEVRGETLGALLIGFRRSIKLTNDDLTRLEEFCQGSAVAIANARTQERITAYAEKLEDLVKVRTSELAHQTARAEEANHAKSKFLANMSHELRTPLTAIVGYSSVLTDGLFGELNEKQQEALSAITRSGEHLKNLIDDVLNLARIESGKEQAEPVRVDLTELLTQTYNLVAQSAQRKSINLLPISLDESLLSAGIWSDKKHLQQILINLLSNAVKYTQPNGKVWLTVEAIFDKVKISVHDTGVGIPTNKLNTLFERFERGDDEYSKTQEGTGIGLDLTKRLVELNGGRIGVTSEVGKGSSFWIMMPVAAETETRAIKNEDDLTNNSLRLDGLSTLVVDDNYDTCAVIEQILKHAGAEVKIATTVKDGLDLVKENRFDIILTDLALPGESGLTLIEDIRKGRGNVSHLPIIVLSACAYENDRSAALNAGASLFMPKPFKPIDIIKNIRNLALTSSSLNRN
jgi:signal transduction histidine kinase/ActR/RegA family two-component response regulator